VGDRGVIDQLHHRAVRIFAIEAPCPIAVSAGRGLNGDAVRAQEFIPGIDYFRVAQDKPEVMEALRTAYGEALGEPVQGEIITAGAEIDIVRIGTPFDLHPQEVHIKALTRLQFLDMEGHMAQATGRRGAFYDCLHLYQPVRFTIYFKLGLT
jgi:hypothetical protein